MLKDFSTFYGGYLYEAAQHLRFTRRTRPPQQRFVIFARGRSGTTLLVDLLNRHPSIACDNEILRRRACAPHRLIRQRMALTSAPVYGFKLLSYQLQSVQTHIADKRAFLQRLVDDGCHIVYVKRTNLLRHALSNLYARHRSQWHQTDPDAPAPRMRLNPDTLLHWLNGSAQLERFERELLDGLPHLAFTYEDDLQDAARHADTVRRITDRLGLPPVAPKTALRKTTPRCLEDIVTDPSVVRNAIQGTPYASHLDTAFT
jgi:LPS sulfotransferase NodH